MPPAAPQRASLELDTQDRCRSCALMVVADPPPRLLVARTERYVVAHAFDAALEGWLVVVPRRHVVTVADLDDAEVAELGPLLRAVSRALADAVGCPKTYVLQLAETPGFNHVHFHVVPRRADLDEAHRGAGVFGLLGAEVPVDDARQDAVALAVRDRLVKTGAATAG